LPFFSFLLKLYKNFWNYSIGEILDILAFMNILLFAAAFLGVFILLNMYISKRFITKLDIREKHKKYNTPRKQNKKNHSLIPKELRYEDYL
jgi:hypothetical protein